MDKEENQNNTSVEQNQDTVKETEKLDENLVTENKQEADQEPKEEIKELTPEEKIAELEDKVARTFAEMENQRRRFEKEKNDAFEYGGFAFAKEALNLVDNLERSKLILENDENFVYSLYQRYIDAGCKFITTCNYCFKPSYTDNSGLSGPPVDGVKGSPQKLFMLANNRSSPECCPSTFSTSTGCVCTTKNQRDYISTRGINDA